MAEIHSYGAYLPRHRMPVAELHGFYGRPGRPRARTLATPGLDEDALTMAYEAAVEALSGAAGLAPAALIAVTQSAPFGLRKLSGTLRTALGLGAEVVPYDLGGHAGGLMDAFALAEALAETLGPALVVASDHLISTEERAADTLPAGGASAFLIAGAGGLATLGPQARAYREVYDLWRLGLEPEPRYRLEVLFEAYATTAGEAFSGLERATERGAEAYTAVCASQPHPQALRALGRLGVSPEQLERTSFVGEIGNLGTASVGLALALGLDGAGAGDDLLLFGYGGGEGIAQAASVTSAPAPLGVAERIAGDEIALGTYYRWTRGRNPEPH